MQIQLHIEIQANVIMCFTISYVAYSNFYRRLNFFVTISKVFECRMLEIFFRNSNF